MSLDTERIILHSCPRFKAQQFWQVLRLFLQLSSTPCHHKSLVSGFKWTRRESNSRPMAWLRTHHPHKKVFFLIYFRRVYSTRTFVIPVVLFTVCYNIPKFFELRTETVPAFLGFNGTYNYTTSNGTFLEGSGLEFNYTMDEYEVGLTRIL